MFYSLIRYSLNILMLAILAVLAMKRHGITIICNCATMSSGMVAEWRASILTIPFTNRLSSRRCWCSLGLPFKPILAITPKNVTDHMQDLLVIANRRITFLPM